MDQLLQRITIDPGVCHGKPCVRGLRYPVAWVLEMLGSGMSMAELLSDYPDLEPEDLAASLLYGANHGGLTETVDRDGDWFIASCRQSPGANGQGRTAPEALASLRAAVKLIAVDAAGER